MENNVDEMSFGERIAYARKEKGLTQDELAAYPQVSKQAVSAWERNESSSIEGIHLVKVAHALDVSPAWIMLGHSNENAGSPAFVESQSMLENRLADKDTVYKADLDDFSQDKTENLLPTEVRMLFDLLKKASLYKRESVLKIAKLPEEKIRAILSLVDK